LTRLILGQVFHPPKEVAMSIFLMFLNLITAGVHLGWDPDGLAAEPTGAEGSADAHLGLDPNG
jgi:hypothetical protein